MEVASIGKGSNVNDWNLCIRLRNVAKQDQVWDISMAKAIYVGRDADCHVHLGDDSVSRKQCRIYIDKAAMVENLSLTNVTRMNDEPVRTPVGIGVGDRLKCGRITLAVDFLYISDPHDAKDLSKGTTYINV